jgi:putative ABC transport system ATP-binding protein
MARAMANQPRLLLADEPTGNLDDESAERVIILLEALRAEHGCTLVVVTHDQALAARADRRFFLHRGSLAEPAGLRGPNAADGLHSPNAVEDAAR